MMIAEYESIEPLIIRNDYATEMGGLCSRKSAAYEGSIFTSSSLTAVTVFSIWSDE